MVGFDALGRIQYIDPRSGPVGTDPAGIVELENELGLTAGDLTPAQAVTDLAVELEDTELITDLFTEIGTTTSELNGARADVRTRETNLGRLAADSTLWFAQQELPARGVDVALKNGGGIRDTIVGPSIIGLTIGSALAFNNAIVVVDLTGEQFLATMENAVSRIPSADGRFPQIAGMVLEYDLSQAGVENSASENTASRIVNLAVTLDDGTEVVFVENGTVVAASLSQTIVLATNSFLLTGGDGYAALAAASGTATTITETNFDDGDDPNLENGEQEVLVSYIVDALSGSVDIADPPPSPRVREFVVDPFISEIHYDNDGADTGEFFEITASAGIDLANYTVELYNGSNGEVYNTVALSGVVPDEANALGAVAFLVSGIQNGAPDGLALLDGDNNVMEFLSYEGAFTATNGAANGMMSTDIGVSEVGSTPAGESLQLVGDTWTGPIEETPGDLN